MVCKQYTRSYLYHTVCRNLPFASHLLSLHNVAYMQRLTREMRAAIKEQRLPKFVREFLQRHYPKVCGDVGIMRCRSPHNRSTLVNTQGNVPQWVRNAMEVADISLEGIAAPLDTQPDAHGGR